jgi:hypothetical protein
MFESHSDVDEDIDVNNYRGILAGEPAEKFIDPKTGALFEYFDLCSRMLRLRDQRDLIDQKLGLEKIEKV